MWFVQKFTLIGEEIHDDQISSIPKEEYTKFIKQKVQKEACVDNLTLRKSIKKMKKLEYKTFGIQPYIISTNLSLKQIKMLLPDPV